jgi:hypothetical protein
MAKLSKIIAATILLCMVMQLSGDVIMIQGPMPTPLQAAAGDTSSGGKILLENGSGILLEDGSFLLKESGGTAPVLLLENGSVILLESGDKIEIEH